MNHNFKKTILKTNPLINDELVFECYKTKEEINSTDVEIITVHSNQESIFKSISYQQYNLTPETLKENLKTGIEINPAYVDIRDYGENMTVRFAFFNKENGLHDLNSKIHSSGFIDWNSLTLDEMVSYLEKKHMFSSTGDSRCVNELIKFYKENKLDTSKENFFKTDNQLSKEHHREDSERLKNILIQKGFKSCGIGNAEGLWMDYSENFAAGFLGMSDDDEELYDSIKSQLVVVKSFNVG